MQPSATSTLGYFLWRPGPRISPFVYAFRVTVNLSVDAADGAERHSNLFRVAIPRNSDALQWTTDRLPLRMSLK